MTQIAKPAKQTTASRVRDAFEQAQEDRRRDLFRQRLELAKQGVSKFQSKEMGRSALAFHSYIRVLEELKGVPEGGLNPSHFDVRKDIAEILLLSGIYWDLAKAYDRTRSEEKQREFRLYLNQFVSFSKGFPHQNLSAETLRKFLMTNRAIHTEDFKQAYKIMAPSRCFVVTAVLEFTGPDDLVLLRRLRDEVLKKSDWGRALVALYYRQGPRLAAWVGSLPKPIKALVALPIRAVAQVARALLEKRSDP